MISSGKCVVKLAKGSLFPGDSDAGFFRMARLPQTNMHLWVVIAVWGNEPQAGVLGPPER